VANLIYVVLIVVGAKSWGMVPRLTFRAASHGGGGANGTRCAVTLPALDLREYVRHPEERPRPACARAV
jgi:hypothetical protein